MLLRNNVKYIVVHCSDTPADMDIGAAEIREWHLNNGWIDIGYHYVIRRDGTLEPGREIFEPGAHVRGHNQESIGICLVGGAVRRGGKLEPQDNFTRQQRDKVFDVVEALSVLYPKARVVGHCDLDPGKTCPNFDVSATFGSGYWVSKY